MVMEKKITIPAEVLEKLRLQLIEQVKDNNDSHNVTTVSWDYIHTDGNIVAIDAEVVYSASYRQAVCSTDRGDDEWLELSRIDGYMRNFAAKLYNQDDELLTELEVSNINEVNSLFDVTMILI